MSRCLRGLCAAAVFTAVAAAVLLIGVAQPAAAEPGDDFSSSSYTAAQQTNTKAVLNVFGAAIPGLGKMWTASDFCQWPFVTCYDDGVNFGDLENKINPSGTLPNIPDSVNSTEVLLTDISMMWPSVSGTLPDSWSRLPQLQSIWLWHMPVSGTLPSSWSQLSQLQYVAVVDGKVTGSLPSSWSALTHVSSLYLHNNSLTGPLPTSWANMAGLIELLLQNNDFCGCVPSAWLDAGSVFRTDNASSVKNRSPECATTYACPTTTTTTTTTAPILNTTTTTTTSAPVECEVDDCVTCDSQNAKKCVSCKNGLTLQQGLCVKVPSKNGGSGLSLPTTAATLCAGALLMIFYCV